MTHIPRIAIIDDDALLLERLLANLPDGILVETFADVPEFLDYVQEHPKLDAVFVDLNLPDVNGVVWQLGGLSVIQKIRSVMGDDAPCLCVFTGMDRVVHINTCLKNGADSFIEKSTDVRDMASQILLMSYQRPSRQKSISA